MIQLNGKRKIIIGVAILIIISVIVLLVVKNNQNKKTVKPITNNQTTETNKPRVMTQDEKINVVGIDPAQEAEVLNDQNGLYIYRIKK